MVNKDVYFFELSSFIEGIPQSSFL